MNAAKSWFDQGKELYLRKDLGGALNAFRNSLKVNPQNGLVWVALADVLQENQQAYDALECLKRGASVEPRNVTILTRLAAMFRVSGEIDDAQKVFDRAVAINHEYVPAWMGLAGLYEETSRPDDAAVCYRKVLALKPDHAEALANIIGLGRDVDVSAEIELASQAMSMADDREHALIGYGLGKALERLGRYDEAFEVLAQANAARRSIAGAFRPNQFDRRVERMIEIFSDQFFKARSGWGDASEVPVFVVGLPRSGTTLTEQIIGSHPMCHGAGELAILTDLATGTPDRLGRADPPWPETAGELSSQQVSDLGRDFVTQVSSISPREAVRVVDKQPLNFWHLGLVAMALPNAKIIHCRRDLRDNGFSIYAQNFNPQQRWATDLGDIAHYWRGYRKLMDHWSRATGLQILDVVYEDTVADLEGQSRRVLEFLDLPWDDRVLDFHKNDRAVQTPSKWQVRQPLYTTSKEKWRNYEEHLGPLIDAVETGEKAS